MRAVLDTNVIVSAILSHRGAPARVLKAWTDGAFELVTSPRLLDELRRILAYPKLGSHITPNEAAELVALVERASLVVDDPADQPPVGSSDPEDDYLIALAAATRSLLVTGDSDLLALSGRIPVVTPSEFAEQLSAAE